MWGSISNFLSQIQSMALRFKDFPEHIKQKWEQERRNKGYSSLRDYVIDVVENRSCERSVTPFDEVEETVKNIDKVLESNSYKLDRMIMLLANIQRNQMSHSVLTHDPMFMKSSIIRNTKDKLED